MAHPKTRLDDVRQDREQYPEVYGIERQRERQYHADKRGHEYSTNYPQYGAAERRYSRDNEEHYGPRHDHRGPPSRRGSEFLYGGEPRLWPPRFGNYDEVRHDSFGYQEVERRPHSFGPDGQWDGGAYWRPEPAFFEQEHAPDGDRYSGVHRRHPDPDYHQWRDEQIRKLDRDYDDWRRERYHKFSSDFDSWRSNRPRDERPGASSDSESTSSSAASPMSGIKLNKER